MMVTMFDATIKAQFLKDGDLIERGGREIKLLAVCRNDQTREIGFACENDQGGIIGGKILYDVDVSLGTEIDVPADFFD